MKRNIICYLLLCCVFNISIALSAQERLKMTFEDGVYTIPCEVNGLRMRFILDTGASSVCISSTEALFMLKNGYLEEDDIKGFSSAQIANGEIIDNVTINLKLLKIGSITLKNVNATVIKTAKAPLLLGLSAISRLGSWTISNGDLVLNDIIKQEESKVNNNHDMTTETEADILNKKGVEFAEKKKYKQAFEYFSKAAILNCAKAQLNMAFCYFKGKGVKKDYQQAFFWLQKAAESGDTEAQQVLADEYFFGANIPKNFKQAAYWYEIAANQEDPKSQLMLSILLSEGKGIIQNEEKSLYWLKKSAQNGFAEAQLKLGRAYFEGSIILQDSEQAIEWLEKAAKSENKLISAEALCGLGHIYYNGYGVNPDYHKGCVFMKKAAEKGYKQAQYNLGIFYLEGKGVPQSKKEAKRWFKKSAAQGYRDAEVILEQL